MKKTVLFIVILIVVLGGVFGIIKYKNSQSKEENKASDTTTENQVANSSPNEVYQSTIDDSQKIQSDIILFYGSTCPHCKKVQEFLTQNKAADKLKFENLEVYNNKQNAQLMQEKQDQCKDLSDDDKGGVPFLYSSEKCVVGDQPIIDYFKQKLNIS